jgi:hemerythrin-like domain-containing protein
VNQIAWAEQIRTEVDGEFDRVANAITATAERRTHEQRLDILAVIEILEEKRAGVMANNQAGYFIQGWQELRDQVRSLIIHDERYKAIKNKRGHSKAYLSAKSTRPGRAGTRPEVLPVGGFPDWPLGHAIQGETQNRAMNNTKASDLLRADHRRIEDYLDNLILALKHLTEDKVGGIRQDFLAIQSLASVHFEQEERVFYPEVRPKAPQILAQMDKEHEVVRETETALRELLKAIPLAAAQRDLDELHLIGIEFHDAIQVHIVDEEDQLLKLADSLLTVTEQQRIATAMLQIATEMASREI